MTLLGFQPDPDFNRLRTALFCRQPDRVPLAELWIDAPVKEAILGRHIGNSFVDPDYDVEADIDFMYGAGYDYVHVEPRYSFPMKPGLEVPENAGTVLNWADFGDYQWPTIADVDFHWLDRAVKYLPSGMGIITGTSGIFEAAWRITGFTTFCLLMHDQPDLVAAIMQRVGALLLQIFERGAAYPRVGALWISDDIAYASGPMLPPAFYRQHLFPWYRQMADICRQRDLPFLYHSDGLLWKVLPDLIAAGFNAIQPIEPKVMDIVELKRQVGDRLCLIGNIDLGYTLTRGTPAEVEAEVRERIRTVGPGGGYCVGSSNTVTYYVPPQNYIAMIEATRRYGKYPLEGV
ncbi:MAG TPA: uroporphyrinogen decarboxylase family protein [Anaerolineae bacterium]|nr:uroporphyrinogen decarboxylase family protein [Anaerolineae bacterium]HQJ51131.1 uroporphyrinogen decarboxylase family protein [Anaerolineae bacterium]